MERNCGETMPLGGQSLPRKKPFLLTSSGESRVVTCRSSTSSTKDLTSVLAVVPYLCARRRVAAKKVGATALFGGVVGALCWYAACAAASEATTRAAGRAIGETRRGASIHWDGVPLRDALHRLPQLFDEPMFVDRRIDPNQRVSLDVEASSVDDVLKSIAEKLSLGTCRIETLRYLGPRSTAEQLRTVVVVRSDEVARLPAAIQASLGRQQRLTWPRFTEPRGLVRALAQDRGWRVAQADRIPHDLWAAGSLPSMTLIEQLTVLLAGFDLTFHASPSGRSLEIVPLEPTTITRRYRVPARLREPAALLQQQLPDFPARIKVQGETISVDGRIEDHERLMEILRGTSSRERGSRPVREMMQIYTLRVVEQPVGAVLRQLAERLGWQLEIDEAALRAAGLSLEHRVSFAIENGDQDDLLKAMLHPAGLAFRREGERVIVVPGD